jgi:hypothetical protein
VAPLPRSQATLLIRTDFEDAGTEAWVDLVARARQPSPEGFLANLAVVDDPTYDGATVDRLLGAAAAAGIEAAVLLVGDHRTLAAPDRPVLVIDARHEPGRTFRVVPSALWSVENNLSLANLDSAVFAAAVDD